MTKKELLRLTAENDQLRQTIEKLTMQLNPAAAAVVGVEAPIVKERMPRDPDEDAKVLEILKEIDQMNAKKPAKKAAAKASKTKTPAKEAEVVDVSIPYDAAAKLAYEASDKKMTYAKFKAKYEADAIDLVKSKRAPKSDSAEATVAEETIEKTVKKTTAAKKATPVKKVAPKKKEAAPAKKNTKKTSENDANPWGALSESTLKRKTIAQLTEYLETRVSTSENAYFLCVTSHRTN
jgi:hypothetical protein